MATPLLSDAVLSTALETWEQHGRNAASAARVLGVARTTLISRIDQARLRGLLPASPSEFTPMDVPGRLHFDVADGVVLIGSDCHYWEGVPSPAHRAFVRACHEMRPKAVILNGDVLDGARISRHASINWEERPTLLSEIEACKDRLGEITVAAEGARRFWPLGNHDCLSSNTECLTRRGWTAYADIRPDDLVLSLDGERTVWSPINEIVDFPYVGEMITIDKLRMSMSVTPNHRVLLDRLDWRTASYDIREFRRAADLPFSFNIPMAGHAHNADIGLSDDQIALAGWVLTDGHFGQYNISLYQSKPDGIQAISSLLDRLGLEYSVHRRQRNITEICGRKLLKRCLPSSDFHLSAESSKVLKTWVAGRGRLPDWAFSLSDRQFGILLDAMVAGDGVWDGNVAAKTCAVLYKDVAFLESVQAVAVCFGWRARLAIDNRGDPRLCLAKEPKIRIDKPQIQREPYNGMVWCLRVPLENFMVRRNGCAYFTGNSRFETKLANVAPEYAKIHGVHLQDHFPDYEPCWSVWINDDVVVKHRIRSGVHATHNNTVNAGKTTVTGHLHSLKVTPYTDYNGTRFGVDTGTLADPFGPQFNTYMEDGPRNHRSGFVVLTFRHGMLLWPEVMAVVDYETVQFRGKLFTV